jgi:hypothetical protein
VDAVVGHLLLDAGDFLFQEGHQPVAEDGPVIGESHVHVGPLVE